jgi:hypothetical protein
MTANLWALIALAGAAGVAWVVAAVGLRRHCQQVVRDFAVRYPGQCFVCSLHRHGLYTADAEQMWPEPHECIERTP